MSTVMHNDAAPARGARGSTARRPGPMEALFDIGVFVVFGALWVVFAIALIWSQGSLDQTWTWLRSLPLVLQGVIWLAIGGLAFMNIVLFFPRAVFSPQP
jgi:hypothetical protein